jgi:hypothetical protein
LSPSRCPSQNPWNLEALALSSPRNFAALNQVAADASLWLMEASLVQLAAATCAREPYKPKIYDRQTARFGPL